MSTPNAEILRPDLPNEGAAPVKSQLFHTMAAQLDAAMKGKELPTAKPAEPEPAKPEEKPVEKPVEKPAAKAVEKPVQKPVEKPAEKEPVKLAEEPTDPELANVDDPNFLPDHINWKRIRPKLAELKEQKQARAKLEAEKRQLAEELEKIRTQKPPEAPPAQPQEIESLKKSIEEIKTEKKRYEDELKMIALERTPEFKSYFDGKFNAAVELAKSVVPTEKQVQVDSLMQLPPSAYRKTLLAELMADMDPVDQSQLSVALLEMDRARNEKATALKNQQENYKRLQELEAIKQQEQQKATEAQKQKVAQELLSAAKSEFSVFNPAPDSEEEKAEALEAEKKVLDFINEKMEADELLMLPVKAAELPRLQKKYKAAIDELEKLRETVRA